MHQRAGVSGPITTLLGLFFFLMLQGYKLKIYSPKQARKVIKSVTNGGIGFIYYFSKLYKEIQPNQGTNAKESKSYQIFSYALVVAATIPMHARKVYSAITTYKLEKSDYLACYMWQQYHTLFYFFLYVLGYI